MKDNSGLLNYTPPLVDDDGLPLRRQRVRRGEARITPAGMDLLAEYDLRVDKLLRSTLGSAPGVAAGSGESGSV